MTLNFLSILFLPLISAFLIFSFGRFFGFWGCFLISILSLFFSFLSILPFFLILFTKQQIIFFEGFFLIKNYFVEIPINFFLDFFSILMIMLILFISIMVQIYSAGYMSGDRHKASFLAFLNLFTFSMLIFVSSNSLILTFFGWEGVGLISFSLISFWSSKEIATKAGFKALLVNKFGDCFLLLAFLMLFCRLDNFSFSTTLKQITENFSDSVFSIGSTKESFSLIAFSITIAAFVKSAQFFFHIWLPDAMEGPTPVSALLHAATMVTAGVFSIIRFSNLLEISKIVLSFLSLISLITLLFASILSTFQEDVKKIIAFSTCAQLSIMFISCSFSSYSLAFFHLVNHAFYKAFLFLLFGIIIHLSLNQQDLDGSASATINFFYINIFIVFGNLSLMAIPPFSGYFSKDIVSDFSISNNYFWFFDFFFTLTILSIFFSTCYSGRLIFEGILQIPVGEKVITGYIHKISPHMLFPVVFLGFFSVSFGFFFEDFFSFFVKFDEINNFTFSNSYITIFEDLEEITSVFDDLFILILAFCSLFTSWFFVISKPQVLLTKLNINFLYNSILNKKWGFDFLVNTFSQQFYKFSFLGLFRICGSRILGNINNYFT